VIKVFKIHTDTTTVFDRIIWALDFLPAAKHSTGERPHLDRIPAQP
jgi:hypothetical protein